MTDAIVPLESSDILPGIYAGFVSVVLFLLVTAIFIGAETTAQGTLAAGALGSTGLGFMSVRRELATPVRGTMQFLRPWLWFTAFAAVGLYDGRYEPLIACAVLTLAMAACHLAGGAFASWRQRTK